MAFALVLLTVATGVVAVAAGGVWLSLLWPALAFGCAAVAYVVDAPELLGKRPDGRLRATTFVPLLPFFSLSWLAWYLQSRIERAPVAQPLLPTLLRPGSPRSST